MAYRNNQKITCPLCGEGSLAKLRTEMDGWTKVGEYLACALCDGRLEQAEEKPDEPPPEKPNPLADFLGTEKDEITDVLKSTGEARFCRDCVNLMDHPFRVHCLLHKKDVEPMNDCDQFERRPHLEP
jgi:hypothetical protein